MLDKDFIFNGKSNRDFGAICCYFDKGAENNFAVTGKTELNYESTYNGSINKIISNNYSEPLKFSIGLIHEQNLTFTPKENEEIVKWLCNPIDYKHFKVDDELYDDINYFVKFTEPQHYYYNGFNGLMFNAVCQHPYGLSNEIIKKFSTSEFTINNRSDETEQYLYPELIEIKVKSPLSTLTITNTSDIAHNECVFNNLKNGEVITMNCLERIISSTDTSENIITKFNKNWIRMVHGKNVFTINGNVDIKFTYREVRKVGIN